MKVLWFFLYIGAAFYWFSAAFGFVERSYWSTTLAFLIVGLNLLLGSLRELTE